MSVAAKPQLTQQELNKQLQQFQQRYEKLLESLEIAKQNSSLKSKQKYLRQNLVNFSDDSTLTHFNKIFESQIIECVKELIKTQEKHLEQLIVVI